MSAKLSLAGGYNYGAFELKSSYQKNLALGIIFAGLLHIIVIGGLLIFANTTTNLVTTFTPQPVHRDTIVINLPPPPPPIGHNQPTQEAIANQFEDIIKLIGIPNPVPETVATKDATIPTQDQLSKIVDQNVQDLLRSGISEPVVVNKITTEEDLPPPNFRPVDEKPILIIEVQPEYPPLAKQEGIEGVVWVKAWVDKNGKVREALILKPSGASAGFEEAALAAAYKNEYKPAISNNQPVALWVVYPVRFALK
jgi:TonB family protein